MTSNNPGQGIAMWDDIKRKTAELAAMDQTCQVFGARSHNYHFGPPLSEEQIARPEARQGFRLPPELRSFYLECGDGGPGPYYGMRGLEELEPLNPHLPWIPPAELSKLAREGYEPDDEECEYYYESDSNWAVPDEFYRGMVKVVDYGCGHNYCMVINGPQTGLLLFLDTDAGMAECHDLRRLFNDWLTIETGRFTLVMEMFTIAETAADLDQRCLEKDSNFYKARDYLMSCHGIRKPASLFGENENRYHGAVQFPWYEQQFRRIKAAKEPKARTMADRLSNWLTP